VTQALSLAEAAEALGKPEAVLLAMARGYTRKGGDPRPDPGRFEIEHRRVVRRIGAAHAVMSRVELRADGRLIYAAEQSEAICASAAEAAAALTRH